MAISNETVIEKFQTIIENAAGRGLWLMDTVAEIVEKAQLPCRGVSQQHQCATGKVSYFLPGCLDGTEVGLTVAGAGVSGWMPV
jgi:hypothetical protein